jgi:hypothetical protein
MRENPEAGRILAAHGDDLPQVITDLAERRDRHDREMIFRLTKECPSAVEKALRRYTSDDKLADSLYRTCYIALMMTAQDIEAPPTAKRIRRRLSDDDLEDAAHDVFRRWLDGKREENRKGALVFLGCHMSKRFLPEFEKYIAEAAEQGRPDVVADARSALTLGRKS